MSFRSAGTPHTTRLTPAPFGSVLVKARSNRNAALFGVIWIVMALGLSACGSVEADKSEEAAKTAAPKPAPPARIVVPSGTPLHIVLKDGVSASKSEPGTEFTAYLADPVVVNGKTALAEGSRVVGRVVDAKESGRVKGRAALRLVLTSVVHNGKSVPVETQTYVGVAKSTKKRDAGVIGGAAGVGAVIGAIAGGGKGAATGAAIGGAGGTGAVLATRGEDVHYPPETRLTFVLAKVAEL